MLRNLIRQILSQGLIRQKKQGTATAERKAGSIVFVTNIEEPICVSHEAKLYSDLASVRLRTFPPALHLASSRPVYLVPPTLFSDDSAIEALQPIEALIITKFSTTVLCAHPKRFEAMLDWLSRECGKRRLFADITDNYAAVSKLTGHPFPEQYQMALGENCVLTVPCEALKEELAPIAKFGIYVIEDPFESPHMRPPNHEISSPLRLCWFGILTNENREMVTQGLSSAATGLSKCAAELYFVTHETRQELANDICTQLKNSHPYLDTKFIPWTPETTWKVIDASDLVILPQNYRDNWGRVKSHNRLVESIRGGTMAIAPPIPSYLELADYAWIGEDLGEGVAWALSNTEEMIKRILAGQEYIASRFSPEQFVNKWELLLTDKSTLASQSAPAAMRLNLGCGDKILPGYVNVDVAASRAGKSPDVLCDLHDLTPFTTDSVDEVLAVHVVEHFWRWEIVDVLKEWVRVLKPGGHMILECPNLITACEELVQNPVTGAGPGQEGQRTMWVFYGDPSWRDPLMCHRWNYTPQSLGAIMAEAGLINIRQEPAQYKLREPRDMRIVGDKPPAYSAERGNS